VLPAICLCLAVFAACHHDTPQPKLEPGEVAPLPPSSGTPVGYLIDAAPDLKLTGDQVTRLQSIDDALGAQLESIDSQLRASSKPAPNEQSQQAPMRGGRGMRGGGMHGGGMGGGGRGRRGPGQGSGSAAPVANPRLVQDRAREVRQALARALAVLDPDQQTAAKKLLADRDIDVDEPVGSGSAAAEP
jgi:hypothetical protein